MPAAHRASERLADPIVLLVATLLIYGRAVRYPFVLDDAMVIVHNDFLRSIANLPALLVSDYSRGTTFGPGYFRPLMMITLALQGHLFGWTPGHFHLVNLLLHALAAWALYGAARSFGCTAAGSLAGALLFVAFPPAQEAVGSVVGRCDILAALFFLLGWRAQLLWQRGAIPTGRAGAMVFGFGLLAMLGKESGAVFAGAAAVTAIYFLAAERRGGAPRMPGRDVRGQSLIGAAAFAALAAYFLLRRIAVGGIGLTSGVAALSSNPVASLPQPQRTYAALYGLGRLLLALPGTAPPSIPLPLARRDPFPLDGPLDPPVLVPIVILVAMVLLAGHLLRRGRGEGVGLAIFLMGLLPASNLVVVGAAFVGERFLYVPFAGLALAAAVVWDRAAARLAGRRRIAWIAGLLAGGLVVAWGTVAAERVTVWRSEETIADYWTRLFPWQTLGWNRAGLLALDKGDLAKARACFERSLVIDPGDAEALGRLGRVLEGLGLHQAAAARLRRSVELRPADPETRAELARALLAEGDKQAGLEEAMAAHALRPALFAGHHALATALFDNGRYGEAAEEFRQLLEEDGGNAALQHAYILSLDRAGRAGEASAAAREASRRLPADPRFDLWNARLAARRGDRDQAIADLAEARRKRAPVALWLERVDDLAPLRDDPRARALAAE